MKKTLCSILLFASMAGGCDDESALPQEHSETDLSPDPDVNRAARIAESASEDPNPDAVTEARSETTKLVPSASGRYDRNRASEYVHRYAKSPNPETAYCAGWTIERGKPVKTPADCTNFASQVLWYGGLVMDYTQRDDAGWWYTKSCEWWGSSQSWRTVNGLLTYLTTISGRAEFMSHARDLRVGDLIFYRLRRSDSGYRCDVGNLFNHTAIVSGFDGDGEPLVSYHSNEAEDIRWNVKNGSHKALGEACAVAFVHIKD